MVKTKYEHVFSLKSINKIIEATDKVVPPPPPPEPNRVMHFGPKRSDEEVVYGSKFNLSIDTLLNNSNTTRLAVKNKKDGTKKVPRRQNAWILYRRDRSVDPRFHGMKSSVISKQLGEMWNKEPEDVREVYAALARLAEAKHIEKHKNYKYRPNLNKTKRKGLKQDESSAYCFELKFSEDFKEDSKNKSNPRIMDGSNSLDSESTSSSLNSPEFEDIMDDLSTESTTSSPQISEFGELVTFDNGNSREMTNEINTLCSNSPTFEESLFTFNSQDVINESNLFNLESSTTSTSSSPKSSDYEEFLDNSDSYDVPLNFPTLNSIEYNNTVTSLPSDMDFQQYIPLDQSYDIMSHPEYVLPSNLMNDLSNVFLGSNFYENVAHNDFENLLPLQLPSDYYGYVPEDNSIELFKDFGSLQ